jgi:type I restriction enzyme S subunit
MSLLSVIKKDNIPNNWGLKNIGAIVHNSQYGTNKAAAVDGCLEIIGMKDIQNGKILTDNLNKVNLTDAERKKIILNKGDILINRTNSYDLVGKVGLYNSEKEIGFASYLVRLSIDRKKADSVYINLWLNSYVIQRFIKRIATRAISQANINPTEFKKFCPVPLPPLPEQKAIADLLTTWDEAGETAERLIKAKEERFHGSVQRLIAKHAPNWPHIKPKQMFNTITEKNFPNEELLSVTQDRGVLPRCMSEGRVMSPDGTTAGYKLIQPGDFAISLRSFQGGIEYSNYRGIISPAYTVLRPKIEINTGFYRLFFKTFIFIEKYLSLAVIGIRDGKQISIPDFMSIKIPVPPLADQKLIAETLSTIQQEIDLLKALTLKYKTQKRGLMQKLLTGQWRVKPEIHHKCEEI